jgi:hypothetical protein
MSNDLFPFEQLAAVHDAAKERAHELRRQAIATLLSQAGEWVAGNARRWLSVHQEAPCHS